jgi:HD-GYP domain-containing protein (c-di-GMP phosphodiesterase class II)
MTTIADTYDALRTKRPYKEPQPADECAAILRKLAGRELHPQLTANFLCLLDQVTSAP